MLLKNSFEVFEKKCDANGKIKHLLSNKIESFNLLIKNLEICIDDLSSVDMLVNKEF